MESNNSREILEGIIKNFSTEQFIHFFRSKNISFKKRKLQEDLSNYNNGDFTSGEKIGEIEFQYNNLIVCAFRISKDLTARSGKKKQYELGKRILRETNTDAGIFIFHDQNGNFRFSLIYTDYLGTRRSFSYFKRFTYYVSPSLTNRTFLDQIGNADFSSLDKIKEAFSVEPVTKQFYEEIQNWYFWAMDKVKFPEDYKYSDDPEKDREIRDATNLIRLITRIIFIWFIKEKGLIPEALFDRDRLKDIVKDFNRPRGHNYYNAILQNLFFATLNSKMDERGWAKDEGYPKNRTTYGVKNLYRYEDKFLIGEEEVLNLFKEIPFLNGGLFDCLDKEDESGRVIYIDGFSRNSDKQAIIPDYLFFQQDEIRLDLSEYGLGSNKPVRGLIEILKSYNFTIDENTPVDQEVALDPELLGKVFENLLASYNPETATTARKATGSYYTPREIVDYMVDESLKEYFKTQLPEIAEDEIELLVSYKEDPIEFSQDEKHKIISAIDRIKILDPACGSGAFPMGILHKLVHILQKIDPNNDLWYELQYQKALRASEEAFKEKDKSEREAMLKEINDAFDESINYPDYARKLYIIENCIYGVDIQPIAIQISKLRFFISLILDQKVDKTRENFGIRALPNLETKFVAANTLIGLEKPDHIFYTNEIKNLEEEIKRIRHKYFTAKTRKEKLSLQKEDKRLREELKVKLKSIGFSSESSERIASFDLYDPNASATWFDPEWMFGVNDGFDIVIGNPPYVSAITRSRGNIESNFVRNQYPQISGPYNIYILFLIKGVLISNNCGIYVWIIPNSFLIANYAKKTKEYLIQHGLKFSIDVSNFKVFKEQRVYPIIILGCKKSRENFKEFLAEDFSDLENRNFRDIKKVKTYKTFKDYGIKIFSGTTGFQAHKLLKFIKDIRTDMSIPFIVSGNIERYFWSNKNVRYMNNYYEEAYIEKNNIVSQSKWNFWCSPKIIIAGMTKKIEAVYCDEPVAIGVGVYGIYHFGEFNPKFLTGLLNSSFMTYYLRNKFKDKHLAGGYLGINKFTIENLPLIEVENKIQKIISELVDQILSTKKQNPQADTSELEKEIDRLVYKLYDLTADEIKIIESS